MSDTPPKPKPGSLRDRIAAFENKAATTAQTSPPPPRPKPAGFATWKPRQPSPPASPPATVDSGVEAARAGSAGMSAVDAKESITRGGSLKERMAALQGKGAFGAPTPPAAPKPVERPKWKPPPTVASPPIDDEEEDKEKTSGELTQAPISPPLSIKSPPLVRSPKSTGEEEGVAGEVEDAVAKETPAEGDGEAAAEADPEEEERQRRAAIAARMAKLGGARIGMGPPVFGAKPAVPKKPQRPKEEEAPAAAEAAASPPTESPTDVARTSRTGDDSVPVPEVVASAPSSQSDVSQVSHSPPLSMPAPAVPRRTAPPRKKPTKPSAAAPPVPDEGTDGGEAIAETPSLAEESAAPAVPADSEAKVDVTGGASTQPMEETKTTDSSVEDHESAGYESDSPTAPIKPMSPSSPKEEPASAEAEERTLQREEEGDGDEDEEARRKRVAEKLAKMGGVNPFALPSVPFRRSSAGSTASAEALASPPTSPPLPLRKPSLRKDSAGSIDAPPASTENLGAGSVQRLDTEEAAPTTTVAAVIPEEEEPASTDNEATRRTSFDAEGGDERDEYAPDDTDVNHPEIGSHDYELTPQPPIRVPSAMISGSRIGKSSALQRGDSSQVDPDIIASVLPPPPLTAPPTAPTTSAASQPSHPLAPTPAAPLPPRVVPESRPRSPSTEGQTGPSPPRRIVPETPEQSDNDNERADDEAEPDSSSELAASTLFVPPPRGSNIGAAFRTKSDDGQDDGEESEPPLQVPPRTIGGGGKKVGTGGGTYEDTDTESNASGVPLPVPLPVREPDDARLGQSPAISERSLDDGDDEKDRRFAGVGTFAGGGMKSSPLARPSRTVSAPPPPAEDSGSEYGDEPEQDEEEEKVLRTRPLSDSIEEVPLVVRPPAEQEEEGELVEESKAESKPSPIRNLPPPPGPSLTRNQEDESPPSPELVVEEQEVEVLDEEEGDPIDPEFHSPSRRTSTIGVLPSPTVVSLPPPHRSAATLSPSFAAIPKPPVAAAAAEKEEAKQQNSEEEEDADRLKRKTIAERMAKLGGIKFGAAPIPGGVARPLPVPRRTQTQDNEATEGAETKDEEMHESQIDEEEDEQARRERIAAKLAGMGGMRIGMMPMNMPPPRSHILKEETRVAETEHTPVRSPPTRAAPPARPPPPPQAQAQGSTENESDKGSVNASEDGVKVEAEESEMEEVGYEDVRDAEGTSEDEGEEVPPPVPARGSRGTTSSILPPSSRPPVPAGLPFRRASGQSVSSTSTEGPRKGITQQHSDYVMVDEPKAIEEEEEVPPPPPARPANRPPPTRATPSVPSSSLQPTMSDSISSQWELEIPSSWLASDSAGGDLSLSWPEAEAEEKDISPRRAPELPALPFAPVPTTRSPEALHLSADELMATWGRVGVQICEIATTMHDKMKKTPIGDGTYRGFIDAVLTEVPNASRPSTPAIPYGYLVFLQNGSSVQKRTSEIMPGDVVEFVDARFKGHKGLQGYQMHVGAAETGGALLGIVSEFDHKRNKARVFQANLHAGQSTVEAVNYRLDDMKSGLVKVYRVLEAR